MAVYGNNIGELNVDFKHLSELYFQVEDAQSREAPIQRLADSIAGPFVYSVMTLSAATFAFWYAPGYSIFLCCP